MKPVAWSIFTVTCGLYAVGGYFGWETRSQDDTSSWGTGGVLPSVAFMVSTFMFPLVGVLIATWRPGNAIAWILLAIGTVWGIDMASGNFAAFSVEHQRLTGLGAYAASIDDFQWVAAIGLMGTFLLLLFPDGHLPGPGWRWVAWLAAATIAIGSVVILFAPGLMTDSSTPTIVNPLGITALAGVLDVARLWLLMLPVAMVGSAASLVVRYRRSHGAERQQLKWLATAAGVVAGYYAIVLPLTLAVENHNHVPGWARLLQDVALFSFCLIPISIGFAVFRYRLYDIDVIIRRTLIYTSVVAVLAALYLTTVTVLSAALQTVTGQSSALAVTASTLLAVVAFRPLHRRVQRAVDRRFSRLAYDAARTLEAFSGRMREQIDLDALSGEVLTVVTDTVQPAHASLWLRPPRDR
jgi:hypothetical protein